jgi:hypothetical protein
MDILGWILPGFIFGVIGIWLIREARRRANFTFAFSGIALCFYPYFVSNPWLVWGIGLALCVVAWQSAE